MSPFHKENSAIIDILDHAQKQIMAVDNPQIDWLKQKILMDLKKHSSALKMNMGIDVSPDVPKPSGGPLKKMFGKEITVTAPPRPQNPIAPFSESSFEISEKELAEKVDYLYPRFLSTPLDQLIDSLSDIEIRGVAKKAGLPVTEDEPKKITTQFVDQIVKAIQAQGVFANAGVLPVNFDELSEEEKELAVLKADVDKLYDVLEELSNKEILESYSELQIRGVAKKAGLPVTEDEPAKIVSTFITQIKEAKAKQLEIANAGK